MVCSRCDQLPDTLTLGSVTQMPLCSSPGPQWAWPLRGRGPSAGAWPGKGAKLGHKQKDLHVPNGGDPNQEVFVSQHEDLHVLPRQDATMRPP
ncbi:unnamed protein product [Gadus morhua 'NCC']